MNPLPTRRRFLQHTAAGAAVALGAASARRIRADGLKPTDAVPARKFRKAVKFAMIGEGKTVREKFELIKSLGIEGVEVHSPGGVDKQEALDASKATGIQIHGVLDAANWKTRLSDPQASVRDEALKALLSALDEAKFFGASTSLVIPGKVNNKADENFDQVWERSVEQLNKAIPKAKELGVHIAIEVVWNDFLTTPELMKKYIDQFNDPIVGAYVDPSNVLKYGKDTNTRGADWIRTLGKRVLKFDFKGYSYAKGFKANIGEGDENWPDVLKALDEVGYKDPANGGVGWATAEVGPGRRDHLKDVATRMDRVLGMA